MPPRLRALFKSIGAFLDQFYEASERFLALLCLALVVPLAAAASIVLLVWGDPGPGAFGRYFPEDVLGTYLGAIALVAMLVTGYSAYSTSPLAQNLAAALDRAKLPIAYTASALLVVFAVLHWLVGR